ESRLIKLPHADFETVAFVAEPIGRRNGKVFEGQLAERRAMRAHSFARSARQSGRAPIGKKSAHATVFLCLVRVGVNQSAVGYWTIGNPKFAPVQQIIFAVSRRRRAHRRDVRAGIRLGDRKAADRISRHESWYEFF